MYTRMDSTEGTTGQKVTIALKKHLRLESDSECHVSAEAYVNPVKACKIASMQGQILASAAWQEMVS